MDFLNMMVEGKGALTGGWEWSWNGPEDVRPA